MNHRLAVAIGLACTALACTNEPEPTDPSPSAAGTSDDRWRAAAAGGGTELRVAVPRGGVGYVNLRTSEPVDPSAAGSTDWDLAFSGWDVHTNGGPSGPGDGSAFGPLDAADFLASTAPEVPFMRVDHAGGALSDWYFYDSPAHALYSRFHVYGVKHGERLWKVQILGYYGEVQGAPVSALYSVRFAELGPQGAGPTTTLTGIDGTAGGLGGTSAAPSGCVELATGEARPLTPDEAASSDAWDLCFRRDAISVNGELGGPGGVGAIDVDQEQTEVETLADVKARTADGELARFDAVSAATFAGGSFRGDRNLSVFGDAWLDRAAAPYAPSDATWLVVAADGTSRFLLVMTGFEGADADGPGTVVLRAKAVP